MLSMSMTATALTGKVVGHRKDCPKEPTVIVAMLIEAEGCTLQMGAPMASGFGALHEWLVRRTI